jgi:hypothetical protein
MIHWKSVNQAQSDLITLASLCLEKNNLKYSNLCVTKNKHVYAFIILWPIFHVPYQIFSVVLFHTGGTWWRSWLRHFATSRKVTGLISDSVIGIFL